MITILYLDLIELLNNLPEIRPPFAHDNNSVAYGFVSTQNGSCLVKAEK